MDRWEHSPSARAGRSTGALRTVLGAGSTGSLFLAGLDPSERLDAPHQVDRLAVPQVHVVFDDRLGDGSAEVVPLRLEDRPRRTSVRPVVPVGRDRRRHVAEAPLCGVPVEVERPEQLRLGERLSDVEVPDDVTLLLENTAGKGTIVGRRLADLDRMVASSAHDYDDLGVCLDTRHLFAAGYDFTDEEGMDELVGEIGSTLGLENVHCLHLNDSKHPLGSEKDEHEHVGEGEIGEAGFRLFVNHDALRELPMVLETPENGTGYAWNVAKVKELYAAD